MPQLYHFATKIVNEKQLHRFHSICEAFVKRKAIYCKELGATSQFHRKNTTYIDRGNTVILPP